MAGPNPRAGVRDMLLSLAVLLVPIVAIVWFFQTAPDEPQVDAVDWQPVVARARAKAPFTVVAPKQVPADWKATKAVWAAKGDTLANGKVSPESQLSLGFINGETIHIAYLQTTGAPRPTIADVTRQGVETGRRTLAGQEWTEWLSPDERTKALSRVTSDGTVIVISGDTDLEALAQVVTLLG